ncbi:MAG: hypothetical protein HFF38_03790 [Lawsonibacter sp.]|nr:hypothetical protein [Lawsonibacter sp.]
MGRSSGDVGGYRGRRTITDILRFIAIALAVVVGLMLAVMLYLQKYLVYTDDGVRLELPPFLQMFRQGEEESNPPGSASLPEPGSVSLIEEPDVSQQEPDPVPEPDPEPKDVGSALQLSVAEARDGSAAAKLEAAGAQVLVLEVKDQMGQLAWHAEPAIAGWSSVNGPQQAAEALKRWNEGEIYTVARVHCFRDDTVPYYNNNFALRWAGNDWNWYDELGLRWTSPGKEEIRAYNAALCGELAAMGFDEIVLEEFYFPIQGKLDTIRRGESYDSSQFTAQVEDFLTKVQEAVEPYGTKISLRVGRETLTGGENVSGVTTQMIEQYAYRVWVEQDGLSPAPAALLEQAGITGGKERLALIVSELEEESSVFQAVFPDKDNV